VVKDVKDVQKKEDPLKKEKRVAIESFIENEPERLSAAEKDAANFIFSC
jgi:hypothetical protein